MHITIIATIKQKAKRNRKEKKMQHAKTEAISN